MKKLCSSLLAWLLLCLGSSAFAWQTYQVTPLYVGNPDDPTTRSWSIAIARSGGVLIGSAQLGTNPGYFLCGDGVQCVEVGYQTTKTVNALADGGQIAGSYYEGIWHAYLGGNVIGYGRGLCSTCGMSLYSSANGANDRSEAVGVAEFSDSPGRQAFRYTARKGMVSLGTLGGTSSEATHINASGQVTGTAQLAGDADLHAFLYAKGAMRDLGTLGGHASWGKSLNRYGHVVGCSLGADDHNQPAFLFDGTSMKRLPSLGGPNSCATDINDRDSAVGYSTLVADGSSRAVIFQRGRVKDLNTLLDAATGAGWVLMSAEGINNAGQIAGTGSFNGHPRAFLLTPLTP